MSRKRAMTLSGSINQVLVRSDDDYDTRQNIKQILLYCSTYVLLCTAYILCGAGLLSGTMDILELSGLHTPPLHTHKGAPEVQLKRKT